MAKIQGKHFEIIKDRAKEYLAKNGYTIDDVKIKRDPWTILHQSGAYSEIGQDFVGGYPDYNDAHFETALKKIYPNVFT
jgi:hypothetical protein